MASLVKALYSFSGEGQTVPLPLAESSVVLREEINPDGWCRGFSGGREGWFPAAYVEPIKEETMAKVSVYKCKSYAQREVTENAAKIEYLAYAPHYIALQRY